MNTKFLKALSASFSPFNAKSGRTARHILAMIPSSARAGMKITINQLPRAQAAQPSVLEMSFKDGTTIKPDLEDMTIAEIEHEVNRHSRRLARLDDLKG